MLVADKQLYHLVSLVNSAIYKNSHNFRTEIDVNVIQDSYCSLQRELSFDTDLKTLNQEYIV